MVVPPTQMVSENLSDFVAGVSNTLRTWQKDERLPRPWFRGHENAQWKLLPGAYRDNWRHDYEGDQIRDFILAGRAMVSIEPQSDWEWYFLMQHHEVPTRLLDWTENCLAGLYFALRKNGGKSDAGVWMMDPFYLNSASVQEDRILSVYDQQSRQYRPATGEGHALGGKDPIAVVPPEIDRRITAQASAFTVHGSEAVPIEDLDAWRAAALPRLLRFVIPAKVVGKLLNHLYVAGVKESSIFPDLDGLGREIRRNYDGSLSFEL